MKVCYVAKNSADHLKGIREKTFFGAGGHQLCCATNRRGEPCGNVAMTRYGYRCCWHHGGAAARAKRKDYNPDLSTMTPKQIQKWRRFRPNVIAAGFGKRSWTTWHSLWSAQETH